MASDPPTNTSATSGINTSITQYHQSSILHLKQTVAAKIGSQTFDVYPLLPKTDVTAEETSHAFHLNLEAVRSSKLTTEQAVLWLAVRMNVGTQAHGHIAELCDNYDARWSSPTNWTFVSYRDASGNVMANAVDANSALKPVQDGAAAACRPQGVQYLTISTTIDWTIAGASRRQTFLQTVELPQSVKAVTRANNQVVNLATYTGEDPMQMSQSDVWDLIVIAMGREGGPCNLLAPQYGGTMAVIDDTELASIQRQTVFRIHEEQLFKQVFRALCPTYVDDPKTAVLVVHQVYYDNNQNRIVKSFEEYSAQFMLALRAIIKKPTMPFNLATQLINNLDPTLKSKVDATWSGHLSCVDMSRRTQLALVDEAILQITKCVQELAVIQQIVDSNNRAATAMMGNLVAGITGKTIPSTVQSMGQLSAFVASTTSVNSVAESTLKQYSSKAETCWGCGEDGHVWWRNGTFFCPKKNDPLCIANAEKERDKWKSSGKGKRQKKRRREKSNKATAAAATATAAIAPVAPIVPAAAPVAQPTANAATANAATANAVQAAYAAGMAAGTNMQLPPTPAGTHHVSMIMVGNAVLAARIPVTISPGLPHVTAVLGTEDMPEEIRVNLTAMVDTGSVINCANLPWALALAKRFPHLVHEIIDTDDGNHQPVALTGVIDPKSPESRQAMDCKLTVLIRFHTMYADKNDMPILLELACGNLAINCILGIPFLKTIGGIVDIVNNRVICTNIKNSPTWNILLRQPSNKSTAFPPGPIQVPASMATSVFVKRQRQIVTAVEAMANRKALVTVPAGQSLTPNMSSLVYSFNPVDPTDTRMGSVYPKLTPQPHPASSSVAAVPVVAAARTFNPNPYATTPCYGPNPYVPLQSQVVNPDTGGNRPNSDEESIFSSEYDPVEAAAMAGKTGVTEG